MEIGRFEPETLIELDDLQGFRTPATRISSDRRGRAGLAAVSGNESGIRS